MTIDWKTLIAIAETGIEIDNLPETPEPEPAPTIPEAPTGAAAIAERFEHRVFTSSETLDYLRALARARMVSPWALLGTSLAHALSAAPFTLRGPAFVGAPFSLNFFTALVGGSGTGKSACVGVFNETHLPGTEIEQLTPSSGEGIVTLFIHTDKKGEQSQIRHQVISVVDEIATLGAMQSRQGSTLPSILRSVWSGSAVGQNGAELQRRRNLQANTYRYCLIAGVQPSTASILLDDAGAGTPQRFLWMPAHDPGANKDAPEPGHAPFTPTLPSWVQSPGAIMTFPGEVREWVRGAHELRMQGHGGTGVLDGHATLTKCKVAAGLAVLQGRAEVTMKDWETAEMVMNVSNAVREEIVQAQIDAAKQDATTKGRLDADRAQTAEAIIVTTTATLLAKFVHSQDAPVTRQQLRDHLGRKKDMLDEVVEGCTTMGWINVIEEPRSDGSERTKTLYTKGKKVPR